MVIQRMSFGFICTEEDFNAVQRRPSPEEQVVIDVYREVYEKAMGHKPHGFHYIPMPRVDVEPEETACVWLPIERPTSLVKSVEQAFRNQRTVQR